jgi:primosomal protein N' (replication factor Y)
LQYADIVVDTKTNLGNEFFTYKISPKQLPYIKTGVLVSVPFRSKKILGLVLGVRKYSNLVNLKEIDKIVETKPILDHSQIELARWISSYYLAPIGNVIFAMIPPIAHRQTSNQLTKNNFFDHKNYSHKLSYTICDRIENRIKLYLRLICKAVTAKKTVLMLFAKIELAQNIIKKLEKEYNKNEIAILYSNLTITERYKIWQDIKNGNIKIVIGSRSAVFAPLNNLGVIIVDDPNNFGYKEEQTPKYNAVSVAERISKINSVNLVYGMLYTDVNILNKIELKKNKIVGSCKLANHLNKINFLTVDMANERNFISFTLENKIRKYLYDKKKILLFVNQKGAGSVFICNDCNNTIKCPKCSMPFHILKNTEELFCPRCNVKEVAPQICPVCKGTKLKSLGIGTKTIENIVRNIYPSYSTKIIESEKTNSVTFHKLSSDITIATSKIFDLVNNNFDLTAIITIDNQLNLPNYNAEENIFMTLIKLASMTKEEFIIQTHSLENYIINNFPDIDKISNHILHERKVNKYPPYYRIIKLVYKNESEQKSINESERVYKILNSSLRQENVLIIGPSPCFIAKRRNKFYYQIIIKTQAENIKIKSIISKISALGAWSIDVDPVSLI